jgi:hypothetical protein
MTLAEEESNHKVTVLQLRKGGSAYYTNITHDRDKGLQDCFQQVYSTAQWTHFGNNLV